MSEQATPSTGAGGGWLGAISSFVNEAQKSLNSLMGWEDLEVVEPTAGGAVRGTASDERKDFFSAAGLNMSDFLGKDVTSLMSVPVFIMEPVSMLQKMGEIMEYSALLDLANDEEDQYQRLALVVGFCMGPFGAVERTWKPFNPILGETFEMRSGEGVQYVAEQVSHHPPIGAACASNAAFEYELLSSPRTKFLGNSVEVYPVGRTRIRLKKTGELFWHRPPNAKAHNILLGMVWVDVAGSFTVANAATGDRCELQFHPCGWFGEGRYEVEGYIVAADRTRKYRLTGRWNSHLDMVACDAEGAAVKGAAMQRIWAASGKPKTAVKWGFGAFAARLNACAGMPAPLATDSRRRPDRAALAAGDNSKSQLLKHELEEMQRAEQRQRAARGDVWRPRWFDALPAPALVDGSAASSSSGAADEPQIFDGEWPLQELPAWKWNGQYHQLPPAATVTAEDEVLGQGFNPWCYPNLHDGCAAMPQTLPAPLQ